MEYIKTKKFKRTIQVLLITLSLGLNSCGSEDEAESSCDFSQTNDIGFSNALGSSSKGAQSFQVTKDMTLTSIEFMMTTTNLTSITAKIYQGGSNPENGTLLATSTITAGLGNSSDTLQLLSFSGIALTTSTQYYIVHEAIGGSYTNKSGTNSFFPLVGNYWQYNGSSWTSYTNEDLYFKISGSSDSCF